MLKKISVLITAIFISILAVSCNSGSSSSSSSVTINFNGAKALSSVDGLSAIQKVPTNLPEGVDSIEVIVTGSAAEGELYRNSFDVDEIGDTVSFEVASGAARNFRVIGRDISLQPRYQGVRESVDLPEGGDVSITITMGTYVAERVGFTVNLVGTDQKTSYVLPSYAPAINAALYKPVIIAETDSETEFDQTLDLDQDNPVSVAGPITTTTGIAMTGWTETYQLLMVRATSLDGTIAAMGSAVINNLEEGDSITVVMVPPARIKVVNSSPVNTGKIEMLFTGNSTWFTVASEKYTGAGTENLTANEAIFLVPNRVEDIGAAWDPATRTGWIPEDREVRVTVNGVIAETKLFTTTLNETTGELSGDKSQLKWKTTVVDLTTSPATWTVPDAK